MQTSLLVIGGTGATGREFLRLANQRGVRLSALARDPAKLPEFVAGFQGDMRDISSLSNAMLGIDTVVCLLGTPLILRGPVTLLSEGTANLVQAMKQEGVKRLICVTGMGAGDSHGHGGFLYDRVILPLLLGRIYADKNRQEDIVRASPLDWVLVRPAALTNKPARGHWREIIAWQRSDRMTSIPRADVAAFLLREAERPGYHRKIVNLSGS